jgi:citrate lyase subunit beta / citryl-CoA lyase
LRAYALRALKEEDMDFTLDVLNQLPLQVIRQNWPYGEME